MVQYGTETNRIHTTQSRSLIGTFEEALIDTITIISALNIVVGLINYHVSAQCVSIKMDLLSISLLLVVLLEIFCC